MAEPQNRGRAPNQNITNARNLAAHLLLSRNFNGSSKTVWAARKVSADVDLNTLESDPEELKHVQIKNNCDKAVMDKVRYKITGLDIRYKECLRRREEIGDFFENTKPDKTLLVKFGILFSNFEIFTEQSRLIEQTTKVGRETSPFLTETMIEIMEKSLDAFESSIANEYVMDEIYENLFGLRDCCHDDLQQISLTLIRLENDEPPIYVAKKPSRYQPMDLMFIAEMLRIEKDLEAMKFLTLTSANHQLMSLLRCKVVGRSRGLPAFIKFPIPNVPIDVPNPDVDDLCKIKSQNYRNHSNEIQNLIVLLYQLDESIANDFNFQFMNWLESLRRMGVVVLGHVAEKVFCLDEDSLNNNNDWQRALYFLSVWSRICCNLLNIHKILALYVDKKHGLFGKMPYNSSIIEHIFDRFMYYLDRDFDRDQVEILMLQLQTEVVSLAAEYSPIENPLCCEKFTETPDVTEYHQNYNYEATTLLPENFPSIMTTYSDAIFHQLAVEKFEIQRLAAHHECLRWFFAKETIEKPVVIDNVCGPRVNSFSSNVTDYLSTAEVLTAYEEGRDDVMDHPACEHLSIDLATMARNVVGDTRLFHHIKTLGFKLFTNRFRLYVGTRLEEMRQTARIAMFMFAFMWQSVILHKPIDIDGEIETLNDKTDTEKDTEEEVEEPDATIDDLSDELQALFNNWALLAAERFLAYADCIGLYTITATKTPMESLIYRWLINKYFEPSRPFFYRHDPNEKQYGEKGILFRECDMTDPLTVAEEAEFAEMREKLTKKFFFVQEIDSILDINDENATDLVYSSYVNCF